MGSINLGYNEPAADNGDAGFATGPADAEHWYSGMASAVPKGVWQGVSAVGKLLPDNLLGTDEFGDPYLSVDPEAKKKLWDDNVKALDTWASNPYSDGFTAGLLKGAAKGLTEFAAGNLIGGPWGGAATLGAAEGHDAYSSAVGQGVDQNTALAIGGVSGVVNAATAVLPFKLGSIAESLRLSALGSEIAGNTTTAGFLSKIADTVLPESTVQGVVQSGAAMMGQYAGATYLNSQILRNNGYDDLAKQQDPFDLKMLAAQFVMGAAFHGLGRMGEKPTPTELSTAVDTLREGQIRNSAPVIPMDGEQASAAGDALTLAAEQMRRGDAVDVPTELSAKVLASEVANPAHTDPALTLASMARENQDINLAPIKLSAGEEPVVLERPPVIPKEAGAEPAVKSLTSMGEEQLRFLEDNAPDYKINVDGKDMSISELRKHIDDTMQAEQERVKIYDVAAACAMRNQGIDE